MQLAVASGLRTSDSVQASKSPQLMPGPLDATQISGPGVMADPQPPIVVDTGNELLLFRSVKAAEGYLEAIDVENREYPAAYDSQGQILELTIERVPTTYLFGMAGGTSEEVRIRAVPDSGDRANELGARLRAYLATLGATPLADESSLRTLVEQLRTTQGFTS